MATKIVGGIAVDLIARTGKWVDGFRTAQKHQNHFAAGLKSTAAQIASYAAGYVGIRALVSEFNEQRKAIDNVAKSADRLGISTQAFAAFSLAARKSGSSVEQMTQAITYMTRNIGEASAGNKEMARNFERLNLDVQQLIALSPDEQYRVIAERISRLGSVAAQTSAVMDIFGRSGAQMMNLIKSGAAAIDEAKAKTQMFGTAISREDAASVEKMNDQITDLKEAWAGLAQTLTTKVAPAFTFVANTMTALMAGDSWKQPEMTMEEWGKQLEYWKSKGLTYVGPAASGPEGAAPGASGPPIRYQYGGGPDAGGPAGEYGESAARARALAERYAQMDAAEQSIAALSQQLMTEEEIYEESRRSRLAIIEEAERLELETTMSYAEMTARVEEESQKRITNATRQETLARRRLYVQNAQFIIGGMMDIVNTAEMSAREQFEWTKALRIAEAVVNTSAAIMEYHAQGNTGMAIAAGIIGAAQVAAIASTTFDSGGSAAAATGAGSVPALEEGGMRERPTPVVNLMLQGNQRYTREEVVGLIQGMNEALGDGFHLNVSTT